MFKKYFEAVVMKEPLIQSSIDCQNLCVSAMNYFVYPIQRLNSSQIRSRIPRNEWEEGQPCNLSTNCIEYYDVFTESFYRRPLMVNYFKGVTITVSHNRKLYLFRSSTKETKVLMLDPITLVACELKPLNSFRKEFGACALNGKIYVCGGVNSKGKVLNSVERFDPVQNTWEILPPMSKLRKDAGVVAFNGHLYVFGGFDGTLTPRTHFSKLFTLFGLT